MNGFRIVIALIFLTNSVALTFGQNEPKAILVDEFANSFCSEDNRSRLDSFFAQLHETPKAVGYIIGHADTAIPGRFLKYFRTYEKHIVFRKLDPVRIRLFRGPNSDQMTFHFWIVPEGAKPPDLPVQYSPPIINKQTLFDSSAIDSISNNQVTFGEFDGAAETCDWGLNLSDYANALKSHSELVGYVVGYSDRTRSRSFVDRALRLTIHELVSKHGIRKMQVKVLYGGRRDISEMQLWLVPRISTFTK